MNHPCTRSGLRAGTAATSLALLASSFLLACEPPPAPAEVPEPLETQVSRRESLFVREGHLSAGDIAGAQAADGPSQLSLPIQQRLLLMNVSGYGARDAVYLRNMSGKLRIVTNNWLLPGDGTSSPWVKTTEESPDALAWLSGNANGEGGDELFQLRNTNGYLELVLWRSDPYLATSGFFEQLPSQALNGDLQNAFKYLPVDVNGDSLTDIVELDALSNGRLLMRVHGATANNTYHTTWMAIAEAGAGAVEWLTGHLDLDGRTDIFQIWNTGSGIGLVVHRATGTGYENAWVDGSGIQGSIGESRFFAMDVDKDGRTDLVQAYNSNGYLGLRVIKNHGGTRFSTTWDTTFAPAGWAAVDWLVGDTNLDGYPDLLQLWDHDFALRVVLWQGNGTGFANAGVDSTPITAPSEALAFHAADLNSDGRTDIVHYRDDYLGFGFATVHLYNASTNSFKTAPGRANLGAL